MPHIEISHYPKALSEQEKQSLSEAVCQVVSHYLDTPVDAVSLALVPVDKEAWMRMVVQEKMLAQPEKMLVWPGYEFR